MEEIKMISWNVNGLRAVVKKGFMDEFKKLDADLFALQEIKLQEGQIEIDLPHYYEFYNYAEKKAILVQQFSQKKNLSLSIMELE